MKHKKINVIIVLCFVLMSMIISPMSRSALVTGGSKSEFASDLIQTALSMAIPPNMENSSGKTAFAADKPIADRDFKADLYTASLLLFNKSLQIYAGLSIKHDVTNTKNQSAGFAIMLC